MRQQPLMDTWHQVTELFGSFESCWATRATQFDHRWQEVGVLRIISQTPLHKIRSCDLSCSFELKCLWEQVSQDVCRVSQLCRRVTIPRTSHTGSGVQSTLNGPTH